MKVEGSTASFFRMKVDFPRLSKAVGFEKMSLIVNVETVLSGMIF
jgi:hypothetical protein